MRIAPSNGKDFAIRLHGCLTTFEGLKQFREIVARKTVGFDPNIELSVEQKNIYEKTLENTDVIRYDYQIVDEAIWLLTACGYEIVER